MRCLEVSRLTPRNLICNCVVIVRVARGGILGLEPLRRRFDSGRRWRRGRRGRRRWGDVCGNVHGCHTDWRYRCRCFLNCRCLLTRE